VELESGNAVAIGFEAPMWIPAPVDLPVGGALFFPRFEEEQGTEWYLQSGAAATAKALVIGRLLLSQLAKVSPIPEVTVGPIILEMSAAKIYLYEGFVVGQYRSTPLWDLSQDEWDSVCCALAYAGQMGGSQILGFESCRFDSNVTQKIISHWETIAGTAGLGADACKGACPTVGLRKRLLPIDQE
jgi:hypothetical protein